MNLKVEAHGLDEIKVELDRFGKEAQDALKVAVRETSRWANKQALGKIAKVTGVQRTALRGRQFLKVTVKDAYGRIWMGFNPIKLSRMNPRKTAGGVTAGPAKAPGAFLMKHGSGKVSVFKRVGSKRLPIEKPTFDISKGQAVAQEVVESLNAVLTENFRNAFYKESK